MRQMFNVGRFGCGLFVYQHSPSLHKAHRFGALHQMLHLLSSPYEQDLLPMLGVLSLAYSPKSNTEAPHIDPKESKEKDPGKQLQIDPGIEYNIVYHPEQK